MPETSVFGPQGRVTTRAALPSFSAALCLLIGGYLSYFIALNYQNLNGHLLFFAIAAGLTCVGVFALCVRIFMQSRGDQADAAFSAIFKDDAFPALLADMSGHILQRNGAVGADRDVAGVLNAYSDDAPALVYRLLRKLETSRRAIEISVTTPDTTTSVEAIRCAGDFVIWTVRTTAVEQYDADSNVVSEAIPMVICDGNGEMVHVNAAAKNAALGEIASISDVVIESSVSDGALCHLVQDPSKTVRIKTFGRSDGHVETHFVPVEVEDLTDANPDQFLDALPVALARVSPDGVVVHANEAARKLLGDHAVEGARLDTLMEGLGRSIGDRINDMMVGRSHMKSEVARAKVQGQEIFLQVTMKRLKLGGEASLLAVINDATELKTLEAQFVQSQKMQAVGQLAGGVAHDFNNLLTAINGHCDLILMRHEPTNTDYGDLIQIRHNANRAASLVGQLLAFSRKQTLLPKVIDLYDTLSDLNHLLNRLLGEKVSLRIDHEDNLSKVRVDKRQLEQVIMNLVVNARDAMPNGGEVSIHTKSVTFDEDFERDRAVVPFGHYIQIDVSDTGTGIPQDKIAKIFEPFFTTKRVGEGTGLGLSTAYGIIKQTGGFIFASSEVGAGTTFTIYLPALSAEEVDAPAVEAAPAQLTDLTGRGVVLLVEDEVPVRSFAARALSIRGYTVIEAASAEEALEVLEDDNLHVDIFVSDVIMPGMDGPTWVRMAQKKRPDAKVVFVSGYAEDAFEGGQISIPNATFLPKPFSLNELTHTVKEQIGDLVH